MPMKMKTGVRQLAIGLVSARILADVILRAAAAVDFRLFSVDDEIGYVPKPNQRGCFLNRRC